jgi:hypothetical protein
MNWTAVLIYASFGESSHSRVISSTVCFVSPLALNVAPWPHMRFCISLPRTSMNVKPQMSTPIFVLGPSFVMRDHARSSSSTHGPASLPSNLIPACSGFVSIVILNITIGFVLEANQRLHSTFHLVCSRRLDRADVQQGADALGDLFQRFCRSPSTLRKTFFACAPKRM